MNLTVCGITYPPHLFIYENGKVITGILAELLFHMSTALNFTFTFKDATSTLENAEGSENSSIMGVFGMAQRKECDMVWLPTATSTYIFEVVDNTLGVCTSKLVILSAGPKGKAGSTWSALSGNPMVFAILIALVILLSILTYIIENQGWKKSSGKYSIGNILWMYYGALFLEPFSHKMTSDSTRILSSMWWICVVVVVSVIGGNMKANLTSKDKETIDTVEDVYNRPDIQPCTIAGTAYLHIFQDTNNPVTTAIYHRMLKTDGAIPWSEMYTSKMVPDVEQGKSVLIIPEVAANMLLGYYKYSSEKKGVFYLSDEIVPFEFVLFLNRDLPKEFKEGVNRKVVYFAATKQMVRGDRAEWAKINKNMWKPPGYRKGNDTAFLSVLYCGGMCLSLIIFLIEIMYSYISRNRAKKRATKFRVVRA